MVCNILGLHGKMPWELSSFTSLLSGAFELAIREEQIQGLRKARAGQFPF